MKTNKTTKIIVALAAVLILCAVSAFAFAESGTVEVTPQKDSSSIGSEQVAPESYSYRTGRMQGMRRMQDYSQLPDSSTDTESYPNMPYGGRMMGGRNQQGCGCGRGYAVRSTGTSSTNTDETEFTDVDGQRMNRRGRIDFSELPEDATDEQIAEFFKKYFMGSGEFDEDVLQGYCFTENGVPCEGWKNDFRRPSRPAFPQTEETEPAAAEDPTEGDPA